MAASFPDPRGHSLPLVRSLHSFHRVRCGDDDLLGLEGFELTDFANKISSVVLANFAPLGDRLERGFVVK